MCSAAPAREVLIGSMTIPFGGGIAGTGIKEANVPSGQTPIAPGLHVEMNIPSTVLRHYDVLIDLPGSELTIAQTGAIQFRGPSSKVIVNAENGLIQIPSQIENKKYNLGLDLGSSISFLSPEHFDKLSAAHHNWPQMTGAIGPANMWGLDDEPSWKLIRPGGLQYGRLVLTTLPAVRCPKCRLE